MKMSCNGCRILRKGCPQNCVIRPCLEWINSPDGQSNATLFLAKFYGRAGLLNLINAAPETHRPEVFKSLLFEACGRIVNPTYGSVGLSWTGQWAQCEAAVVAVINGFQINGMAASNWQMAGTRGVGYVPQVPGIRHVARDADVDLLMGKGKGKRSGSRKRVGFVGSAAQCKASSSREPEEVQSEQTVEAVLVNRHEPSRNGGAELNLDLTLG
ncbi:hypothetical protein Fmac_001586 [Flemingia macrophylla]|uniref:LOB domain-containing protein n=1 Tax=Flemingia macrophylla TaxID=520843 RepID=A0ABD1NHP2_9FABA